MANYEFDDDTEFDLPESPAPINATNGIPPDQMKMMQSMMQQMNGLQSVSSTSSTPTESHVALDGQEDGPHKNWTCVYPIYLDAKRRYRHGCRRVPYEKALLFPNSQLIANAARKLQLEYMHEPYRKHPQDWENPGRVKVHLFDDHGAPIRPEFPTKQSLLDTIANLLQPLVGGKPPPLGPRVQASKRSSCTALRSRQRLIRKASISDQIPPHSPAAPSGLLNINMSQMPGAEALKNMGPIGNMMSSLGLDDDEDGNDAASSSSQPPVNRQFPALGRRQRKRVVRIGR